MKNINLKQPKFILPIILFPFLILSFFVYTSFKSKGHHETAMTLADSLALLKKQGLNPNMPSVSTEVKDATVKDKFDAYQKTFKDQKDFSALNGLSNPESLAGDNNSKLNSSSAYNPNDIAQLENQRKMDSIKVSIEGKRKLIEQRINGISDYTKHGKNGTQSMNDQNAVLAALRKQAQAEQTYPYSQNNDAATANTSPRSSSYDDQMRLFKEQMRMVDSIQNKNSPNTESAKHQANIKKFDPNKDTSFRPLHVSTGNATSANTSSENNYREQTSFNTLKSFSKKESIKAIIDEAKKVTAGARVRIKILQDILVGDKVIPEGSFIYGIVTGFQTQRINISVSSIEYEGKPLPVKLDVFDTDGYLGLYVPNSNFREFTKEIGNQSTQGLSTIQTASGTADIQTSLMNKVFSSSTNTIGKIISKNKAYLKSDYVIYLKENSSNTN